MWLYFIDLLRQWKRLHEQFKVIVRWLSINLVYFQQSMTYISYENNQYKRHESK